MKYLDLTCADAASNLACDEALLQYYEESRPDEELLRVWESKQYFVVLGHSNKFAVEVNTSTCAREGIPILRRVSGGGTVLQGPGCLNYSLILRAKQYGLGNIQQTFDYVLARHRRCLEQLIGLAVSVQGTSDLAVGIKKFSGNAQYRKREYLLIHGTFLLSFDLTLIERYLRIPPKQPHYRRQRRHMDFLANVDLDRENVRRELSRAWNAREAFVDTPIDKISQLVCDRYTRPEWNSKF
jgi:lipoate-protein ligase A